MALARTNVHSQISADGHGTGTFVTSSFTPPNDSLLVVCVSMMRVSSSDDPSGAITCSGGGLTFTSRLAFGSSGQVFALGLRIFTAPVTTGASMTITAGSGGIDTQHYAVSVLAYTGYDTGTPTGATGTDFEALSPDDSQSFELSGAPASSSEVDAFWELDKDAAGTTPGSGWTEISDLQTGTSGGLETEVRTGSTSTTVSVVDTNTGGSIFKFIAGAIEIIADGGGGPPALTFPLVRAPLVW
ncbi:MAG: hypothetical protein ACRD0W_24165 [Acidimicrobiales bacterium]